MQKYRVLSVIGSGAYSQVFKAVELSSGNIVAMKEMKLSKTNMGINRVMLREAKVLAEMGSHPNIVNLIECFKCIDSLYLVLQYLPMDLITYYKSIREKEKRALTEYEIRFIFKQVCQAVAFMHSKNLMHRDIKPENILVEPVTLKIKIIDFGFSKPFKSQENTNYMVTRWYRPLQVVLGLPYDFKVDIFSLGALLLQLYNEREVFRSSSNLDQLQWIISICGFPQWSLAIRKMKELGIRMDKGVANLPRLTRGLNADAQDLIDKMLKVVPSKRITVFQTLQHGYFNANPPKTQTPSSNASTTNLQSPTPNKTVMKSVQSTQIPISLKKVNQTVSSKKLSYQNPEANESAKKYQRKAYQTPMRSGSNHSNEESKDSNQEEHKNRFHRERQRDTRTFIQSGEANKLNPSPPKQMKRTQSYSQGLSVVTARIRNHYLSKMQDVPPTQKKQQERTNSQDSKKILDFSQYAPKYLPQKTGQLSQSSSASKIGITTTFSKFKSKNNGQKPAQRSLNSINLNSRNKSNSTCEGFANSIKERKQVDPRLTSMLQKQSINEYQTSSQKGTDKGITMFAKIKRIVNQSNLESNDFSRRTVDEASSPSVKALRPNSKPYIFRLQQS